MFRRLTTLKTAQCSKTVATWSPLGAALNTKPKGNFFSVTKESHGLFGVPELKTVEGFVQMKDQCIKEVENLVAEATKEKRDRKLVEIFDDLSDTLCKVADLAEFVRVAHPSVKYTYSASLASATVSALVEKLNTNKNLYKVLNNAVIDDVENMDEVEKNVSQLFLFDFEQSGIHLPEAERNKVVTLNESIFKVGQQFIAGAGQHREVQQEYMPSKVKHHFKLEGNKYIVNGLMSDSSSGLVREVAYRVYLHHDFNQEYLLSTLLNVRYELAKTCGFTTYAHRALKGSLLDKPSYVMEFLDALAGKIRSKAESDYSLMGTIKLMESPKDGPVNTWDVTYYNHKIRKDQFKLNPKEYAPYFSLGACMEGLNNIFQQLYGITLENEEAYPGEVWSTDVYKIAVKDEQKQLLGYIFCDFFERAGKPLQESHFTIRGGKRLANGTYQLPIVAILLNLPSPGWTSPSLLTIAMVDNLFHEMGHAMHSMLGRTRFQHVTGTRCSTDFAEVPSILMEYFASDPRVIKSFAKHYSTQEPIPDNILERICASKELFVASEIQLQMFYSVIDQIYHGQYPLSGSTTDVLKKVHSAYYSMPYIENTAWQQRFTHLVGYGAKYYSYLVSKAVASCIWQTYFEKNPFNREHGMAYRDGILAHGGGKPPAQLVTEFLKQKPTPQLLVDHLSKEIEAKSSASKAKVLLVKK